MRKALNEIRYRIFCGFATFLLLDKARAAQGSVIYLLLFVVMIVSSIKPLAASQTIKDNDRTKETWVGQFDSGLAHWQEVRLKSGQRSNIFKFVEWDGVNALEVVSQSSMSLFARSLNVDLIATPILCWRWRITSTLSKADMRKRDGDDYAARIYLSLRLPTASMSIGTRATLALARTIWGQDLPDAALNYVWDNRQAIGTTMPNAYTDRALMIVLRSGDTQAGVWVEERVDVLRDSRRHFGQDARLVQLAVTADTDNTQSTTRSGFADFHFVPAQAMCSFKAG